VALPVRAADTVGRLESVLVFDGGGRVTNLGAGACCSCAAPPEAGAAPADVRAHRVDCMVCGAPLVYPDAPRRLPCSFCGEEFEADAACARGHFVCDACHGAEGVSVIERACLTTAETDMIALLGALRSHPAVPMHGPEHHALVPGIVLATYRALGGDIPAETISRGIRRGARVPGGACAFMGSCGAAVGAGIAFSLILRGNPLKAAERRIAQTVASACLADLAALEAERCCQRESWIALRKAAELSRLHLPIPLRAEAPLVCAQAARNKGCAGGACPLFPGGAAGPPG
jgi:hypothetical protein